jgi:transketolase
MVPPALYPKPSSGRRAVRTVQHNLPLTSKTPERMPVATAARDHLDVARKAKLRLLRMHYESGVGHIGGNLSVLDLLLCLYHGALGRDDAVILSKGHAAGALYVALWSIGRLTDEDLCQFHGEGTLLAGHPPPAGIADIPFATGSLGHGLGLAAGIALGRRLRGEPGRVFCLLSDGEWNEGSTWEAMIFAAHNALDNLTFVVDANGLQGFGATAEVADLGSLAEKIRGFGVGTVEIDGHDPAAIVAALGRNGSGPLAIVAATIKGCGISFMENLMEWHYLPLTEPLYRQAVNEVLGCATPSVEA